MEEEKKDGNFLLKDFSENTTTHGPKNIVSAVRVWAKEIVSRRLLAGVVIDEYL